MRKIIVQEFLTLDGVMQAPGGPEEDREGAFKFGGWTAPYFNQADEEANEYMKRNLAISDLLLGRKTYDIFAAYWPDHEEMWPGVNDVTKYVVSHHNIELAWAHSELITGDVVNQIRKLKSGKGSVLKVIGSGNLAATLFKNDLVDELWLMIFPVTLGNGKRLFGEGTIPAAFKMTDSLVTGNGVIFVNYSRDGDVKTGNVG